MEVFCITRFLFNSYCMFVGESRGGKKNAAAEKGKSATEKKPPAPAKDKDKGGKLSKEVRDVTFSMTYILSSANAFNLEQSKILSCG